MREVISGLVGHCYVAVDCIVFFFFSLTIDNSGTTLGQMRR